MASVEIFPEVQPIAINPDAGKLMRSLLVYTAAHRAINLQWAQQYPILTRIIDPQTHATTVLNNHNNDPEGEELIEIAANAHSTTLALLGKYGGFVSLLGSDTTLNFSKNSDQTQTTGRLSEFSGTEAGITPAMARIKLQTHPLGKVVHVRYAHVESSKNRLTVWANVLLGLPKLGATRRNLAISSWNNNQLLVSSNTKAFE